MLHNIMLLSIPVFAAGLFMMPLDAMSEATDQGPNHLNAGHQKVEGVVTNIKSGMYTVKTQASTYTLSENASLREGHGAPKVGDDMFLWVSENNMVIDAQPKEQAAETHRSMSGKLVNLDNINSAIKVLSSQGETTLKIKPETRSFVVLPKGTQVTIKLNGNGEVIYFHRDLR